MEVVVSAWSSQVHSSPAAENLPFRMAGQEDPSPEGKSAHCWQVVAIKSYVNAFRYLWVRKMESNHQIFHFPLCCLFLKSVMESYWRHSSYNIVDRLATRAHSLCGHQQLHTKLDSECWPNYTTVRTKFVCNLQNEFQMPFVWYLWPWTPGLLPRCNVGYVFWGEKWNGHKVHSPLARQFIDNGWRNFGANKALKDSLQPSNRSVQILIYFLLVLTARNLEPIKHWKTVYSQVIDQYKSSSQTAWASFSSWPCTSHAAGWS